MPRELVYVVLLAGLFVLPKALQRFRLPSALVCFATGVVWSLYLPDYRTDHTIAALAGFGILALFLFAGLEINVADFRQGSRMLVTHLGILLAAVTAAAVCTRWLAGLDWRPAILVALALLTPSTGFILDSLAGLCLNRKERFWVRNKAIASEMLALMIMFAALQTTSYQQLAFSGSMLIALLALVPLAFRFLARHVVPYAPKSEFGLTLIMAVISGYATKYLGAYYLVGAFVVGLILTLMREMLPEFSSEKNLHSVEVFAALFIPFYFFRAGLILPREAVGQSAILLGVGVAAAVIPIRVLIVAAARRITLRESWRGAFRVASPLIPTLIFTLVLGQLLYDKGWISPVLYGALVVYTLINTLLPSVLFRLPALRLDLEAEVDEVEPAR